MTHCQTSKCREPLVAPSRAGRSGRHGGGRETRVSPEGGPDLLLQSWGSENQTPRLTPPWLSRNGRSSPRRRSEPLQQGRGPGRGQRTGQEAAALPGAASSPRHPPAGPPDSSTRDWTQSSRPGKEVGGANKRGGAPQPPGGCVFCACADGNSQVRSAWTEPQGGGTRSAHTQRPWCGTGSRAPTGHCAD